ncbi:hypothetical protein [Pelagerythrobacter aerophilus]|nr:hypothetical protein [Pelagerythrobacter aerophilus]
MLQRSIMLGCGLVILTGCGADEISSPGTGGNVIVNPPTSPPPPPPPPPPPSTVSPAAGCPTIAATPGLIDEGTITGPTGEYRVCALPARVTASSTLPYVQGLLYRLNGRVDVGTDGGPVPIEDEPSVTLTIEPGVTLYASGSSFLMVNRGNQINAVGTAEMPIVFTSRDNVLGLNDENSSGQWGGVVLAGRAPVTDCVAPNAAPGTINCERQVEGAADPARFGGETDDDSSGIMQYVQIRYSGFVLSGNNELQSLTTGGTGTGTELSHIMSYNSSDDGVEFFGGHANVKNLVVVGAEDDALDTDTGVQASLQYVIVASRPNAGDTIIEADSTNTLIGNLPRQNTRISNATFVYNGATREQAIRIRGGADYAIVNSILVDATNGTPCLRIDDAETIAATSANDAGPPVFNSFVMDCATAFRDGGSVTAAQTQGIFEAGSNNNAGYTSTLTGLFINGSNESAIAAFDPTALSSFFDNVEYIGAVRDASDTWYAGWTCNSATADFGDNVGDCTSLPIYSS